MLEVLVAIFVFSIGLIGIAKLQVVSKKANYDAVQRSTATVVAHEIIERMRTNPAALTTYIGAGTSTLGRGSITTTPTSCSTASVVCSPAQLASYDLWHIEQILDGITELSATGTNTGGLVEPTACITGTGAAGIYTIAIAWRGQAALTNPTMDTCGQGSGLYGANDEYRRLLRVQTYIFNQF